MAGFDLGSVLGSVLGGRSAGTGRRRGAARGQQDLGRALAVLAGAAIEAMTKAQQPAPPPPQAPAPRGRTAPSPVKPPPAPPAPKAPRGRAGSVPASGPWGSAPAGKPAPAEGSWAPVPGVPAPPAFSAEEREGVLMLRAMIAAAKADGQVDAAERTRIAEQLGAAGLGAAARDAVLAEFDRDVAPQALAREAADPMLAAQLYAAAVAGAGTIEGKERDWLDAFARALRLDRAAAEAIERRITGG